MAPGADLASKEYLDALTTGRKLAREEGLDKVLAEHKWMP